MRGNNIRINDQILLVKAREFAETFNCKNLQAQNGWLKGWKKRYVAHSLEPESVSVLQSAEAVGRSCSVKKLFFEISQDFFLRLLLKVKCEDDSNDI